MTLNWQHSDNKQQQVFTAQSQAADNAALKLAVEAAASKAVALLDKAINDDSLYLLFSWNSDAIQLQAVVTDADKSADSPYLVSLQLPQAPATGEEFSGQLHFWLKDFLASYPAFFRYSLVAIFTNGSRRQSQLI